MRTGARPARLCALDGHYWDEEPKVSNGRVESERERVCVGASCGNGSTWFADESEEDGVMQGSGSACDVLRAVPEREERKM